MISVIMASYLGEYQNAAKNREYKLKRAINSFLNQTIQGECELIVVSDGCKDTTEILKKYTQKNIKCISIVKQPLFSGKVREIGLRAANYDWICYLDSDDELLPTHLEILKNNIDDGVDWMYYDDIAQGKIRDVTISFDQVGPMTSTCVTIGTSNICHKKLIPAFWMDGYGHDREFIRQFGKKAKKIENAGYIVRHVPTLFDE
jgi:glycosyltransferase involved in cell wall biosynthesis